MKKLRAGIIGLGVGEQHILGFNAHPQSEAVAACDFSKEKVESARKKFPQIRITENARDILTDPGIDVVSIATYDNYHYEQIETALKNGKHVFVEKPLCLYEEEARKIKRLLIESETLKLSSNLILRKSPLFIELKRLIKNEQLGKTYFLEGDYYYGRLHKIISGWRSEMNYYSSVLGGAVHMIDLLLWLTGEEVDTVTASGNKLSTTGTNFRFNDFVVSSLVFKSGAIAKVTANMGSVTPHYHGVKVFGTKGTFINDFDGASVYTSHKEGIHRERMDFAYPGIQKGDLIPSFVDSILGTGKAEVSLEDTFKTMSVCFAVEAAMQQGTKQQVRYI